MAGSVGAHPRLAHRPEDRVAGAERDRQLPFLASGRCRSGCTGCRRTTRRSAPSAGRSARCHVRRQRADRSWTRARVAAACSDRPGAVASSDRRRTTRGCGCPSGSCRSRRRDRSARGSPISSEARYELTRWMRCGPRVRVRRLARELADLRSGEPGKCPRTGQLRDGRRRRRAAASISRALAPGAAVHPDRRRLRGSDLVGEGQQ